MGKRRQKHCEISSSKKGNKSLAWLSRAAGLVMDLRQPAEDVSTAKSATSSLGQQEG